MNRFKQVFLGLYLFIFIFILVIAGRFFYQNLRGIKPIVLAPPYDISQKIPPVSQLTAENKTGLPLHLPAGFSINIFAKDLNKPRVMAFDPAGNLVVSLLKAGQIVALPDYDHNGIADKTVIVVKDLDRPHGIAFNCLTQEKCKLYVAENNKISVFDYDAKSLKASLKINLLNLPSDGRHFTRSIMFIPASLTADYQAASSSLTGQPEQKLLISIGSSCDTCEEKDWRRAKILIANIDGSGLRTFASGLRNSVFMALNPSSQEIWATEMGRDYLGDELPPDEINIIKDGQDYGWPFCYGNNIHDTVYDKNKQTNPCSNKTPAHISLPAHSAPLGLAFFPNKGWPAEYQNDLLVALHGSWNRSQPRGYKIIRYQLNRQGDFVEVDKNGQPKAHDFISGWLTDNERALGRPVDIKILPKGIIFISDDKAGVIYRLVYSPALAKKENKIVSGRQKAPQLPDEPKRPATTTFSSEKAISLNSLSAGQTIQSPLLINGQARGFWFYEGLIDVYLLDSQGRQLALTQARALNNWKTVDYVPFRAYLEFAPPETASGTLVLKHSAVSPALKPPLIFRLPVNFANQATTSINK